MPLSSERKHRTNSPESRAGSISSRICTSCPCALTQDIALAKIILFERLLTATLHKPSRYSLSTSQPQKKSRKTENKSMMGCITSRPKAKVRSQTTTRSRLLRLRARLLDFLSWLKNCSTPSHRSPAFKTYATLSEPGPHIPIEEPPIARYLCGEQIDRYDMAMLEMSLSKRERLRGESALRPCVGSDVGFW